MAQLPNVRPLKGGSFGTIARLRADDYVSGLVQDRTSGRFEFVVRSGSPRDLKVNGRVDLHSGERVISVQADLEAGPSQVVVQRFNRLMAGTGVEAAFYHRVSATALRVKTVAGKRAKWVPLPVSVTWSDLPGSTEKVQVQSLGAPVALPKAPTAAPVPAVVSAPVPEPVVAPEPSEAPVEAIAQTAPKSDPRGLFKYPVVTKRSEVVVKADVRDDLDAHWDLHKSGHRQVLCIVGPTGTGKTSLVYNMAARKGVGIFIFDAMGAREFSDWVGTTHLRDGKTEFVPSGFLQAIDADGPYGGQPRIILIDEVNRAESSGALNALMPVLHSFGTLYVPEMGRGVAVDSAAMVVMTANRGSQYAGTVGLDRALADRVTAWFKLDYLEADAERALIEERSGLDTGKVLRLIGAADAIRRADQRGEIPEGGGISTRAILEAAVKAAAGMPLHRAATRAWLGLYSEEGGSSSEAQVVQSAIDATLRGL